ncbi:MAG: FAD-dependent oxidoreductase [Candidatus Omnitrophica bacterium]|nr:FAD-dependent oxidoreductase [Candidatus Omnitrophota bacterium]
MKRISENIQPALKRLKSFCEVVLGFKKNQTVSEAHRCPQCSHPKCVVGCPLKIDIPGFIRSLREGNSAKALHRIREQNSLAGICGRLCSAPCEQTCILNEEEGADPISIKGLERFAFDQGQSAFKQLFNAESSNQNNRKVAVVGSGPTGLTAASVLVEAGYQTTIFEALHLPGGILRYGIPEFRLPKKVLDDEIKYIESLGVNIQTNCLIGRTSTIADLKDLGYEAILLATGASVSEMPDIPGAQLKGVHFAQEFLMRTNLINEQQSFKSEIADLFGEKIVVIGSDTMALDCVRVAVRLNKQATVICSQGEDGIQATESEREHAKEEGVHLEVLTSPIEILSDENNCVKAVRCIRMDFADKDGKGLWKVVPVKNSEFIIEADTIILSDMGTSNSLIMREVNDLKISKNNSIWIKKNEYSTSVDGVFAAGGVVDKSLSLIDALYQGKTAAQKIDSYIQEKNKNEETNA